MYEIGNQVILKNGKIRFIVDIKIINNEKFYFIGYLFNGFWYKENEILRVVI